MHFFVSDVSDETRAARRLLNGASFSEHRDECVTVFGVELIADLGTVTGARAVTQSV